MSLRRRTCSRVLPLVRLVVATLLVAAIAPPSALAAEIAWTTKSDFEHNASTTGDVTDRANVTVTGDDIPGDWEYNDSVTLLGPTLSPTLFAGAETAVALRTNGVPIGTGRNDHGQLGASNTTTYTAWADIGAGTPGFFAFGTEHGLQSRGGMLLVAGGNSHAQLGTSNYSEFDLWVAPGLATTVTAVAAGRDHSLALGQNGHVYVAGSNARGQIGLAAVTTQTTWIDSGITSVTAIAAGYEHSVAIKSDGTVWTCGANTYGQLGMGDTADRTTWTSTGATGAVAAACGEQHSLVLRSDGTVIGSGGFQYWELGIDQHGPTSWTDLGLTGIMQVAAGRWHSLAVDTSKRVWAAGNNSYGQAGKGDQAEAVDWYMNPSFTGATEVAAGDGYSLVLKDDGYLYGSGRYETGQLGLGLDAPWDYANPTLIRTSWTRCAHRGVAKAATTEGRHSMMIKTDGKLWATGSNKSGQLGDGFVPGGFSGTFKRSSVMSGAADVAVGGDESTMNGHSVVAGTDGSLWVTGADDEGQIGLGPRSGTTTWTETTVTAGAEWATLEVACGAKHSLALDPSTAAGTLYVTGDNSRGQLGLGDFVDRQYWTPALTNVRAIAVGRDRSIAVKWDGTAWVTGSGDYGALGVAGGSDVAVWSPVSGIPAIRDAAAGAFHSLLIEDDGTVWGAGSNNQGQLGLPDYVNHYAWAETTMTAAGAVGGFQHSLSWRSDGSLWGAGDNSWLALGAPVGMHVTPWTQTLAGGGGGAIAAGGQSSFYVGSDTVLYGTGDTTAMGTGESYAQTDGWIPIGSPRVKQGVSYVGAGMIAGSGARTGLRVDSVQEALGNESAWSMLRFMYDEPQPGDRVEFRLRTGDTTTALAAASYLGHTGEGGTSYTTATPGASTYSAGSGRLITDIPLRDNPEYPGWDVSTSRYVEIEVTLDARPEYDRTPVLHWVRIQTAEPPDPDAALLEQRRSSDDATVAAGGWTNDPVTLAVTGGELGAGATTAWAEFEVKPVAEEYDGSGLVTGTPLASGVSSASVSGLAHLGEYKWRVRLVDDLGRYTSWVYFKNPVDGVSFRVDDVEPGGTMSVNGDAEGVASLEVTATWKDAADDTTITVRYDAGGGYGEWLPYSGDQTLTLAPDSGDGTYTVAVELRDSAGNVSGQADGIYVDRAAPTGSIVLCGGAAETSSTAATVTCNVLDLTSMQMRFSVESGPWSTWETYAVSKIVTLPAGDGTKTVDAQFRDAVGQVLSVSDSVLLDQVVECGRVAGASRYQTACQISQATFPSADTVVLATGAGFADALSAAGLAGSYDAPLLLTDPSSLPASVSAEIGRLGATTVYVVGGTGAVSAAVFDAVDALPSVEASRIAGASRYDTAAKVARTIAAHEGGAFCQRAFVARGDSFADALAASPLAYGLAAPVLLVRTSSLPAETSDAIEDLGITDVVIAGGTGAVDANVAAAIDSLSGVNTPVRKAGASRYDTAAQLAAYGVDQGWATWGFVGVATGLNYPDALGGGVACGARGGVMLLTHRDYLSTPARDALRDNRFGIDDLQVFGGAGAVGAATYDAIETALVR